jgi:transposase
MDQIHGDTTSVSVAGSYKNQDKKAVQLRRGYSKDHRPDLKQLVYSLCVSRDGAVPIHFKTFDGNRTDDTIQWEIWNSIRTLLQTPKFIFVGDSKLCVSETLLKIDKEHGLFVTMVPDTRLEIHEFVKELESGDVRWEQILKRRSPRQGSEFDTFECAQGPRQLREGFPLFFYRTSQKKKRDAEDRNNRIGRAWEKLENLDLRKTRGPKTEKTMRKRVDAVLHRYHVEGWLKVDIKLDVEEKYRATSRGKPTVDTKYRRLLKKVPRLHIRKNAEAIARSQLMDGIFPLTTNTKELPVEVLKIYKYQPKIEKRHVTLKSTLEAAPVWLKKNTRIESLMFMEWIAQLIAALIERELRREMQTQRGDVGVAAPWWRRRHGVLAACGHGDRGGWHRRCGETPGARAGQ